MDRITTFGMVSLIVSGITITIGVIAPALSEAKAIVAAVGAMAQQPDESPRISRALFVGLAMIESLAIYCFVVAVITIFANPFWGYAIGQGAK